MKDFDFILFNIFPYLNEMYYLIVQLSIEFMYDFSKEFIIEAIKQGRSDIFYAHHFMNEIKDLDLNEYITLSIQCQNIQLIKYFFKFSKNFDAFWTYFASLGSNNEILEFLIENGCPLHNLAMVNAVSSKNVLMVKYINNLEDYNFETLHIREAIKIKSIEILKFFLLQYNHSHDDAIMDTAAQWGNLEIIELLFHNNYLVSDTVMRAAAMSGNINIVMFFNKKGFRPNKMNLWYAAFKKFELCELQIIHNNLGWLFPDEIIRNCLKYGYIQINELQMLE